MRMSRRQNVDGRIVKDGNDEFVESCGHENGTICHFMISSIVER